MGDKALELIEKMYVELTGKLDTIDNRIDTINNRIDIIDNKLDKKADKSDIVRIENEHGKKLDALFDGYRQLAESIEEIKSEISDISLKVEKQDVEITVIKGGKKSTK